MGQIANTSTYFGEDGTQLLVPGGAPAALSGPIHLCTRADNNNTRYFDGYVAYLGGSYTSHKAEACDTGKWVLALRSLGQVLRCHHSQL